MDYDREMHIAELEAERRAVIDLADAYTRLDQCRAMTATEAEVSPGQLRLVIG